MAFAKLADLIAIAAQTISNGIRMLSLKTSEVSCNKTLGERRAGSASETRGRHLPNPVWHRLATRIQPKLTVSSPDDPYEHEADQVADRVMRMSSPGIGHPAIQRKAQDVGDATGTSPSDHPVENLGSGLPLDRTTRNFMEPRFGRSFGDVRVHADAQAATAAAAISARAFTLGRDIVFDAGQYVPNTDRGRRLLAHELTHVIQQFDERSSSAGSSRTSGPTVGSTVQREPTPDEQAEEEHRKAQQRVNRAIGQTIWDTMRRGEPSNLVWPEHKPKDPARLLANSEEWFRSGLATLTVLTPAPDQSGISDRDKNGWEMVFDPSVVYPNVGGSAKNTMKWEKAADAITQGNDIFLRVKPEMDDEKIARRIIHEVQHIAGAHAKPEADPKEFLPGLTGSQSEQRVHSMMYASLWSWYESEFRAHWLESLPRPPCPASDCPEPNDVDRFGSPSGGGRELTIASTSPSFKTDYPGCLTEAKIQMDNEKQFNVAGFIIRNYFGMENAFLCSEVFRQRVKALDHGESVNFVNSVRIERLRRAINQEPRRTLVGMRTPGEPDVIAAVKELNEVDLLFLKDPQASRLFWDAAQKLLRPELFTWMSDFIKSDKKDAPPPAPVGS